MACGFATCNAAIASPPPSINPGSPFGGVGESGDGREMGFEAMYDCTDAKSVSINMDAQLPPFYKR